ncbi:MAG: ThuA domain-containing protein [Rubripirellula sp.]|nr:ThuA domain-containing protein [Rubripirellula sp.]
MKRFSLSIVVLLLLATFSAAETKPLKALLIAGGCCHDYKGQHEALFKGIQSRANVQVDVYWTDDKGTNPPFPLFEDPAWAKGYDVIIHDECAASNKDIAVVQRILKVHQTIPAVHLHCAMHSFRNGTDLWFKHLGLKSTSHGPQEPIAIAFVDRAHPITQGMNDWTTIKEELYNNVAMHDAEPIATGTQSYLRNGKTTNSTAVVAWVNQKQGARSFSTTLGHNTATVADGRYLDLVTRGLLWACGKLEPGYLQPFAGKNAITFIQTQPADTAQSLPKLGVMPEGATLVIPAASSTQQPNLPLNAFDGNTESRWCAANGGYPHWLAWEFKQPVTPKSIRITWEFDRAYQFRVEGSVDGKVWKSLLDAAANNRVMKDDLALNPTSSIKHMRITGLGSTGGWCSIREVSLKGDGITTLWPAMPDGKPFSYQPKLADPYAKQGNIPPEITVLTASQRAEILKDVKVADGFEATIFAAPPAVNYPVFVAAAANGTLFVSSDGNGSIGRDPKRGRVIRLRDLDGDGQADESKVFCEVDAPRGLVWDHDRLYLMHPPHLSAFIDSDGDGVADEQRVLVKNLAFGYDKRPADHTTNGVSIGVDGWLYIAGGDFGFINAEGTDGRKLTHRGGGVIRVRPDGTGLEIYSTGTRNILEVAVSPRLDLFARDNTNDGGGWDVRFHHFTGGEDHGYPRLYKNFAAECVPPLADYGGGSGCGATYVDEPGFGIWNDAPLTADWGTGAIWHHSVQPRGATFEETTPPQPLVRMTRPTDADVDGNSRLYCASWKGATFKWAGAEVGYVICVKPKGIQDRPMPNFGELSADALALLLDDPSYRRRLAAQRELMRRDDARYRRLMEEIPAQRNDARNLAERIRQDASTDEMIEALGHADPVVVHIAIRALAKRQAVEACLAVAKTQLAAMPREQSSALRALAKMHRRDVVDALIEWADREADSSNRQHLRAALCRLCFLEGSWKGDSWGTRPDTRGPYYQPEEWSQTSRIQAWLKKQLQKSDREEKTALILEVNRHRIQLDNVVTEMMVLASQNPELLAPTLAKLSEVKTLPVGSLPFLKSAINASSLSKASLLQAVRAICKSNEPAALQAALVAMTQMANETVNKDSVTKEQKQAFKVLVNSPLLLNHLDLVLETGDAGDKSIAYWADAAVLDLAGRKNVSPEVRERAKLAIDTMWSQAERQIRLVSIATALQNHFLDDRILSLGSQSGEDLSVAVKKAVQVLRLADKMSQQLPLIETVGVDAALQQVALTTGEISRGQQIFREANCVACHAVSKDVKQQGPYLGNIAATYKRQQLAEAVLQPSKTIAQGFATTSVLTLDGRVVVGFVTNELADQVTLRDAQAKDHQILKEDIEIRKTLKTSVMPEGLLNKYSVRDLAAIVDYLDSLVTP